MSREIKFRGIATVNDKHNGIKAGDFVYGCFVETNIDCQILFGDGEQISVDRKTVGQYTGRTNNVGVEFASDDVVKCKVRKGAAMTRFIGVVKYSDIYCAYIIAGVKQYFGEKVFLHEVYHAQVLGNIHQNPELVD